MDVKAERFDEPLEARKHAHGKDARDTDLTVDDLQGARRRVQGGREGGHRSRLPDRAPRAAGPRDQGGLRVVVRQARQRLPQQPEDRPRPRHRGQRRDDGLRQHGRRLRHRRRLHPRPEHRRATSSSASTSRTPRARTSSRACGLRPRSASSRATCRRSTTSSSGSARHLERHYRNVQDLEFTIERGRLYMLQTRDAKRTAAAAVKIAADMVDEGVISKAEAVGRIEPAQVDQLLRATVRPRRRSRPRSGSSRASTPRRRGGRQGRLRRRHGGRLGRPRREGHPRPDRDVPGRLPRHGRRRGHHHRPRRRDLARGRRRAPDRQAVRRRLGGARRQLRRQVGGVLDHRHRLRRGRLAQPRRHDRRPVPRPAADRPGSLRGPARAPDDPRLGRRDPAHGRLDQRRQARGGRAGPRLRRRGHRPVPHRAHVPRGRPAGDRARRDPRRQRGDAGQGQDRGRRGVVDDEREAVDDASTPRWPSSRCSSRATSRASSGPWTACRSSSA